MGVNGRGQRVDSTSARGPRLTAVESLGGQALGCIGSIEHNAVVTCRFRTTSGLL